MDPDSQSVSIKFKLDYDLSKIQIDKVQHRIAKLLDIETSSLYLCCLKDGCIMMDFLLTTHTANKILPIEECIKNALVTADLYRYYGV